MDFSSVFARWRQRAPNVTHDSLDPESTQPKRLIGRFSHFFLHSSRQIVGGRARACPFPKHCPFVWDYLDPHPTHGSLGPPESITQTTSRSVQPFCTAHVIIVSSGIPGHVLSHKLRLRMGRSESPSNKWFLCPPYSKSQTAAGSFQPFSHSSPLSVHILYNWRGPPFLL